MVFCRDAIVLHLSRLNQTLIHHNTRENPQCVLQHCFKITFFMYIICHCTVGYYMLLRRGNSGAALTMPAYPNQYSGASPSKVCLLMKYAMACQDKCR